MSDKALNCDWKSKFEDFCEDYVDIVQEMADQGDIIDPEIIRLCQHYGITFRAEFLTEMGLDPLDNHFTEKRKLKIKVRD
jgi:hypothetical protein